MKYDFSGWATRNDLKCADGRIIRKDAFKINDGETVPLVWNHGHKDSDNILGHAVLENKPDGVYAYCSFNDTPKAQNAKKCVEHGDITRLSIWANELDQLGSNVVHGAIKEVSLVVAGANPGARIENVIMHNMEPYELPDGMGIICTGDTIEIFHSDDENDEEDEKKEMNNDDTKSENDKSDKSDKSDKNRTVGDVLETMNEEQLKVLYSLIAEAMASSESSKSNDDNDDNKKGDNEMKHNVFEGANVVSSADTKAFARTVLNDVKRYGSLKDSFLAHADEFKGSYLKHDDDDDTETSSGTATYGIDDIDWLFPDAKNYTDKPIFIQRDMGWVKTVMNGVHHTPFSRIKSIFADITEDDARAKGYIKGNLKKEQVFGLLKRTTTPQTIYKKQKFDRDDINDITDFDVIAWIKTEMRTMLDEELARAILVGDGRSTSSDDKISETNIRPIWTDEDLYTIKANFSSSDYSTDTERAKLFIRKSIKARIDYKGSGNLTLFTTEDLLTDLLLMEDLNGRVIYDTVDKLKNVLRVSNIVTVPVMEDLTRTEDSNTYDLLGLYVNLQDYNVGADKGGAVSMFDDFDIDYNQQKYLIETRCSGALVKPYSAIAIEEIESSTSSSDSDSTDEEESES